MKEGNRHTMLDSYRDFAKSYGQYWRLYGGWRALISSPYFHAALAITIICSPIWLDCHKPQNWADAAISILPNLMGFSIAGMAVFLAFSHPETMRAITEKGDAESYFVSTVASFFHFILVQSLTLALAFIGKFYTSVVLSGFGVLCLSYTITSGLAMAMLLLQTARIVNAASSLPPKQDE